MTVICDVCVWMMWLLADSVSDLLHPEGNEPRTSKWHSLCSGMLANVILLCSPLKVIGDHITNEGAQVEGTGENFLQTFNFNELLLLWSEPVIFPKPVKWYVCFVRHKQYGICISMILIATWPFKRYSY